MKIIQFFDIVDVLSRGYKDQQSQRAQTQGNIDEPENCPICGASIRPIVLASISYRMPDGEKSSLTNPYYWGVCLYQCGKCFGVFFARYELGGRAIPIEIAPTGFAPHSFPPRVIEISPRFSEIYNQALRAESLSLHDVSGIGFRKALEFLVKDYLIHKEPDSEDCIKSMNLGRCISEKVDNQKIRAVASRSTWLGNDFTHYNRKFNEFEIPDLKRFITATVAWIDLELTTDEALDISPR